MAWQIVGGVTIVYVVSLVIGFPLTFWIFRKTGDQTGEGGHVDTNLVMTLVAAPVTGFFVSSLVTYALTILTQSGTEVFSRPVFLVLFVLSLMLSTILLAGKRNFYDPILKMVPYLLPLVFIAPYSIVYPLFSHPGVVVWYSDGTDGARYLMLTEYLRHHPFVVGALVKDPLPYTLSFASLELVSRAGVASFLGCSAEQAYTIHGILAHAFIAHGFVLLSLSVFGWMRGFEILGAVVFCISSGLTNWVYHGGSLAHHASIAPFLFAASSFVLFRQSYLKQIAWNLLWCTTIGLGYTITLIIAYFGFMSFALIASVITRSVTWRRASVVLLLAIVVLAPLFVFLSPHEFYKISAQFSRDVTQFSPVGNRGGYSMTFVESVLKLFGVIDRYDDFALMPSRAIYPPFYIICGLFVMSVFVLRRSLLRVPGFLAILAFVAFGWGFMLYEGQTHQLYKASLYFAAMLSIIPFAALCTSSKSDGGTKFLSVIIVIGGLYIAAKGFAVSRAYFKRAEVNSFLVDKDARELKSVLDSLKTSRDGKLTLFVAEEWVERSQLLRTYFRDFHWLLAHNPTIWPEYGMKYEDLSQARYDSDVLLSVEPTEDVIDYSGDRNQLLFSRGIFRLYDSTASYVDIMAGWDWSKRGTGPESYPIRTCGRTSQMAFINKGDFHTLGYELEYRGKEEFRSAVHFKIGNTIASPAVTKLSQAPNVFRAVLPVSGGGPSQIVVVTTEVSDPDSQLVLRKVFWQ
jgi:hypothetical protein